MATGKYDQAPKLVNKGKPKSEKNYILINMDLFKSINEKIDTKHGLSRSLLFLLIGTADGFGLSEKFMTDNLGCTKQGYLKARKHLHELSLITDDKDNGTITINYNVILGISEFTSKKESISEFTSKSITEITPKGISEITHNIEKTNKETKNNGFSSYEEKPTAAPKQVGLAVEPEDKIISLTADEVRALTTISKKALEDYPNDSYFWINDEIIKSKATNKLFRLLN